jgi:hypothetical protein
MSQLGHQRRFQAQAAHFRFSPDSRLIAALRRSAANMLTRDEARLYKIAHIVPKGQLTTLPKYDEMVKQQDKLSVTNARPQSGVVRTIE